MIFIILFGLIAVVVVGLNMIDSSNIEKIENHLKQNQCQNIVYVEGSYQALCSDKIMIVKNSFSVDVKKDSKIVYYKSIEEITKKEKRIYVRSNEEQLDLKFKEASELTKFYKILQDKQ